MGWTDILQKRMIFSVCMLLSSLLFASARMHAQAVGATVSGTVTDQSEAVVVGAHVAIKNTGTAIIVTTTANSDGFYSAPNLQPGTYEVTTTASGFTASVRSGIVLTVGQQLALNVSLTVGQATQKVEVTEETPGVELNSSAISGVINSKTVVELPLNGRDWTLLATLTPAVNTIPTQQPVSVARSVQSRNFQSSPAITLRNMGEPQEESSTPSRVQAPINFTVTPTDSSVQQLWTHEVISTQALLLHSTAASSAVPSAARFAKKKPFSLWTMKVSVKGKEPRLWTTFQMPRRVRVSSTSRHRFRSTVFRPASPRIRPHAWSRSTRLRART